jgi:flap endonuclease-1
MSEPFDRDEFIREEEEELYFDPFSDCHPSVYSDAYSEIMDYSPSTPRLVDSPKLVPPIKATKPSLQLPHILPKPRRPINIVTTLSTSYKDYLQSVSALKSLPTTGTADEGDAAMSKSQLQLAIDEGKFWATLSGGDQTEELPNNAVSADLLTSLTKRSQVMNESYRRRVDAPTLQTYEDTREIIKALGVPCIEAAGAYEAEALASSIVLHGHADYVGSEDTVSNVFISHQHWLIVIL